MEYSGETSRDMFQRSQEHLAGLEAKEEDNALWKHSASVHQGTKQDFQMRLVSKHKTAFDRQISESVNINYGKRDLNLNSKSEWMGESLPRLTTEVKDVVR